MAITHPDRIGHLCVEPDCFIKEGVLGLRPQYRGVVLMPKRMQANQALLAHWSKHLSVITSEFFYHVLRPFLLFARNRYETHQYAVAIDGTAQCARIYAEWADRPPILMMSERDRERGFACLEKMGAPRDAWFVCVHSREGGYSPSDEHLHSYRNSDIETYSLAMRAITERGGWCVRVGEKTSKRLPHHDRVIDYAHSPFKSDWMDVFLCANCHFFLGNSSGLYLLSSVFGKRSALANLMPMSGAMPVGFNDIGIPKLLRNRKTGQLLGYDELLKSEIANFRFTSQYEAHDVLVEDNSPEDIRELAVEMLQSVDGTIAYEKDDELNQGRFQALMRPGHYSYGAASRIGRDFLKKYSHLLQEKY